MKRTNFLALRVLTFLIAASAISCSQKGKESAATETINPAMGKEIELQLREFENALKKGDSLKLGNLYTIDAEILNNGSPSTVGRDNIIKNFGSMIRDSITGSGFKTSGLWGNDKLLVEQGTGFWAHANGKVVSRGRYLVVWKKDDGKWKIFRDTYFSDGKLNE
jgi:ketosteroid isomerase-like protein